MGDLTRPGWTSSSVCRNTVQSRTPYLRRGSFPFGESGVTSPEKVDSADLSGKAKSIDSTTTIGIACRRKAQKPRVQTRFHSQPDSVQIIPPSPFHLQEPASTGADLRSIGQSTLLIVLTLRVLPSASLSLRQPARMRATKAHGRRYVGTREV